MSVQDLFHLRDLRPFRHSLLRATCVVVEVDDLKVAADRPADHRDAVHAVQGGV